MMILQSFINLLSGRGDLLIVGDFNLPDLNWGTLSALSKQSQALCECVFTNNLIQMVSGPTHKLGNTLDLILTNCTDRTVNIQIDKISDL